MCMRVRVCVCVGGIVPHTPVNNSQTPVGYPRIQLTSDTIYLEIDSIRFHRLRIQSYKTALPAPTHTSDASPKPRLLPVLLTNWL